MGGERKQYQADYYAKKQAGKHEVGEIPESSDPELRERSLDSLQVFFESFFGAATDEELAGKKPMPMEIFTDPFGQVQIDSIRHEQSALERGSGKLNKLEPRSYGKSTRSIIATGIWAPLKGVQNFAVYCSDSTTKADYLTRFALTAVSRNKKLISVFPELRCFEKLDLNPHLAQYQTHKGKKTGISIKGTEIWYPNLEGFKSSEFILLVCSYANARGINIDGRRPSIVVLDDVQKTEEAFSSTGKPVDKLIAILNSDIALLGTRQSPVAIINNGTIIAPNDFPSRLCENKAFITVRYRMVESFPDDFAMPVEQAEWASHQAPPDSLWYQYQQVRETYDSTDVEDRFRAKREALDFYLANRDAMDKGHKVTWDHAYSRDPEDYEVSTIQSAMNFIFDFGMTSFLSECQNEPVEAQEAVQVDELPTYKLYVNQVSQVPRGEKPEWADFVTFGVDLGMYNFHWVAIAGQKDGFRMQVMDYGEYPVFNTPDTKRETKAKQVYAALDWFYIEILSRTFGGAFFDLAYIDAGWWTKTVYSWILNQADSRIKPCMGSGDHNAPKEFRNYRELERSKKQRAVQGWHQRDSRRPEGIILKWLDSEFFKRFFRNALMAAADDVAGAMRLFAPDSEEYGDHKAFCTHVANEYYDLKKRAFVSKKKNHFSDGGYYGVAALGELGCRVIGNEGAARKRISLAEKLKQRRK